MTIFRLLPHLFLLFFLTSPISFASDIFNKQKEALNMIAAFANDICGGLEDHGEKTSMQLSGELNAEIKGLLKKLAGLGISGTAAFENEAYQGVLQKDLASLLKDKIECRKMVIMEFKILVPTGNTASVVSNNHTLTGKWNSFFGPVSFSQEGNEINGTLYYSAPELKKIGATANIRGKLADRTLTFVWWVYGDTPDNPTGKGVLTLSKDGYLLSGHFTDKNHPGNPALWQLTREEI
jgi:hypothetical protein